MRLQSSPSSPSTSSTVDNRRSRRRWPRIVGVAVAIGAVMALSVTEASASQKPVQIGGTAVSLRDCYHPSKQPQPGQGCTYITTIGAGTPVTLICQHEGQNIGGDVWWDYVLTPSNGYGYVSDYYVNTGTSAYRVPGVDYCNY